MNNYWEKFTAKRVARRRLLASTMGVSLGAAALSLVGCSDDDSSSNATAEPATGLIANPVNTSKQAIRGGTYTFNEIADSTNLDVHIGTPRLETPQGHVYSRLAQPLAMEGRDWDGEFGPDLAESWELSGDRLQLTLKLRQGVKWHNKAPVSGRLFDAQDVVASWERFVAKGAAGATANVRNPDAPIESVTAPDSKTIIIKTKFPTSSLIPMISQARTAYFMILPKEVDNGFDIRTDMIGTGPFMLSKYQQTVGYEFVKNPDYYDAEKRPYIDKVNIPILPEYAASTSQFRVGNLDLMVNMRPEDVLPLKRDLPHLNMYTAFNYSISSSNIQFGWKGRGGAKSPFLDERVRQAVSMSLDRDLIQDTFLNVDKFLAEGIDVQPRWSSALTALNVPNWVLDPKGTDFGPNAKYYEYNLAEAKKLMEAAGFGSGLDLTSSYPATAFGPAIVNQMQVFDNMTTAANFKPTQNPVADYNGEFIPTYRDNKGNFEGWAAHASPSPAVDALAYLSKNYYSKGGVFFYGFDAAGRGDNSGDPAVDALFVRAQSEFDTEKRRNILFDLQRLLGKAQYSIAPPGAAKGLQLVQPHVQNYGTFRQPDFPQSLYVWVDESKRV